MALTGERTTSTSGVEKNSETIAGEQEVKIKTAGELCEK